MAGSLLCEARLGEVKSAVERRGEEKKMDGRIIGGSGTSGCPFQGILSYYEAGPLMGIGEWRARLLFCDCLLLPGLEYNSAV